MAAEKRASGGRKGQGGKAASDHDSNGDDGEGTTSRSWSLEDHSSRRSASGATQYAYVECGAPPRGAGAGHFGNLSDGVTAA